MDYRFMGSTGVRVSQLCLGTMTFGTLADEAMSAQMFNRAREAGVNMFDCADVYAGGRSEEILGKLIASCRNEVVITTKAYFPTSEDRNARGLSRYHLVNAVEASLRRLNTDRIDVFYLHRFDDCMAIEDTLRTLDDLVRAGKILYPAASNFAAWQVARALGKSEARGLVPFACIQPMYNLVKRQAEVELLPMAQAENLGVFPYSPLAGGLLTGKYVGKTPKEGRLVENPMYKVRYGDAYYGEVARKFTEFASERGFDPVALAIAWVGAHPAVTAPIIGARNVAQLEHSLAAADIQMTPELRAELSELSITPPPATDRNEESSNSNYGSR